MASCKLVFAAFAALLMAPLAVYAAGCSACPAPSTGYPVTVPSWTYPGCPRPSRYSALTGTAPKWEVPVGKCCGVEGYDTCPALSCSYSFAYSASGPGQCAQAYAVIKSATVSSTVLKATETFVKESIEEFCNQETHEYQKVVATAYGIAELYSEAVATTLIYHSQFACVNKFQGGGNCASCLTCNGGSAKTAVKAAIQAVAYAVSDSWLVAIAKVVAPPNNRGVEQLLAYAEAEAGAVATAVNTAVDDYYDELTVSSPFKTVAECQGRGPATRCKKAVAQALTCVIVKVLAKIYVDPSTPGGGLPTPDSASCSASYAVSYSVGSLPVELVCDKIECPEALVCDGPDCPDQTG